VISQTPDLRPGAAGVPPLAGPRLLAEPLPDGFGVSFGLIGLGLLLANLAAARGWLGGMGAQWTTLAA